MSVKQMFFETVSSSPFTFMFNSWAKLLRTMQFYAVARGRNVGIYNSWSECEQQIKGFSGAVYKKFKTQNEAETFVQQKRMNASLVPAPSVSISRNFSSTATVKRRIGQNKSDIKQPNKKAKIDDAKTTDFTSNIVRSAKYGNFEFLEDDKGYVHVYTDGSCENNGRSNAIAGFGVYFGEGHALNASGPVVGAATNNRGEIQAATKAITLAANNGVKRLCINSDSHFVIRSATEWMANWKKKNWKLFSGGAVKNEQDFRQLDLVIQNNPQMEITWKYVPAHTGILGNERADELAREGAQSYEHPK